MSKHEPDNNLACGPTNQPSKYTASEITDKSEITDQHDEINRRINKQAAGIEHKDSMSEENGTFASDGRTGDTGSRDLSPEQLIAWKQCWYESAKSHLGNRRHDINILSINRVLTAIDNIKDLAVWFLSIPHCIYSNKYSILLVTLITLIVITIMTIRDLMYFNRFDFDATPILLENFVSMPVLEGIFNTFLIIALCVLTTIIVVFFLMSILTNLIIIVIRYLLLGLWAIAIFLSGKMIEIRIEELTRLTQEGIQCIYPQLGIRSIMLEICGFINENVCKNDMPISTTTLNRGSTPTPPLKFRAILIVGSVTLFIGYIVFDSAFRAYSVLEQQTIVSVVTSPPLVLGRQIEIIGEARGYLVVRKHVQKRPVDANGGRRVENDQAPLVGRVLNWFAVRKEFFPSWIRCEINWDGFDSSSQIAEAIPKSSIICTSSDSLSDLCKEMQIGQYTRRTLMTDVDRFVADRNLFRFEIGGTSDWSFLEQAVFERMVSHQLREEVSCAEGIAAVSQPLRFAQDDSHTLIPDDRLAFRRLIELMQEIGVKKLYVFGLSSPDGREQNNRSLAGDRATHIRDILIEEGIVDKSHVCVRVLGEAHCTKSLANGRSVRIGACL